MLPTILFGALLALSGSQQGSCQSLEPALPQSDLFNGSFANPSLAEITAQIAAAGLDNDTAAATLVALEFERSNWAGYSILSDPFYLDVPANASTAKPGDILKVENYTNSTLYTLPANTALSRFLFQTADFNGTAVPASAYILWPWSARKFDKVKGYPVVSWAHGTSGQSGECAPSHIRNLWYQYSAPYILALQGYVVVAPDYAGLGLNHDANGKHIPHQYNVNKAAGNDLVYAVQAAQKAYPQLSKEFVVMGHSQGGGAAWGAAQNEVGRPTPGYLGTIAASPSTTPLLDLIGIALLPIIAQAVSSIFPTFQLSDWLSAEGVKRTNLYQQLQGCQSTRLELLSSVPYADLVQLDYKSTWYWKALRSVTQTGGMKISKPMLVLQGTADTSVFPNTTIAAVNQTCSAYPRSQIDFQMFEGADHVPTLYASQRVWLDWIADRFNGVSVEACCSTTMNAPILPVSAYQKEVAYFLEYPLYGYETA